MAQKRMFDKAIIDTDRFMDLPMTAKAIYFLLGMEADDEGFVSYRKVMRIYGGSEDDVNVLAAKEFVIKFPSGVVVITDWNINNYLDKNRIKPTQHIREKESVNLVSIGRNRNSEDFKYSLKSSEIADVKQVFNECLTSVKLVQNSIEENRTEQNSIEENNLILLNNKIENIETFKEIEEINIAKPIEEYTTNDFIGMFKSVNPSFARLYPQKPQRDAIERMKKSIGGEQLYWILEHLAEIVTRPYATRISTPYELEKNLGKLLIFIKQEQNKGGGIANV